ncbi:MAG TPA: ornithine cyclodeaminase family protein [Gemmatimonadaceae bacterium]|jgi:alanine dehydrogenase|nr:ornithine cyclodeaminase family protein [Gemmatimonadaceae bacterium]
MTLVLKRTDVFACLGMTDCITAVERAFCAEALGHTLPAGVLGTHAEHGGFHVKTAGIADHPRYYAAKINANFPQNPARHGRPTIQGVISLHDAGTGEVLALLDSASITALRTGAATAVAAKYLARSDAASVGIVGCGVQARSQVRALSRVRSITSVHAYDVDRAAAERFSAEMRDELACAVVIVDALPKATEGADIVVTCTTAREPILSSHDVRPGAFVAAVGADSADKQELDGALLSGNKIVVDSLEQCAEFGELHQAIRDGLMSRQDVHATLADVVVGRRAGREGDDEITIFDSTGTGLEDVAAAAVAYERAITLGVGDVIRLDA